MLKLLASSRFLVTLAVIGSFIAATVLFVYGVYDTFQLVLKLLASFESTSKGGKLLMLEAIQVVDLFLVAVALYLITLGLFELFIDDRLDLPEWLEIRSIDDLKEKLLSVIVVVMGVYFLGAVLTWENGDTSILYLGGAIAVMILALTYFISQKAKKDKRNELK